MPIFGMMRIKNESRWIARVLQSIKPICDEILVMDDHSVDDTFDICESEGVRVFRSPYEGLDESRDKNHLLTHAISLIPKNDLHWTKGNPNSPYWILAIDGDEELVAEDRALLRQLTEKERAKAFSLRILYLWNDEQHVRVDGVYGSFSRPSLFRLMNQSFKYQRTPWGNGANFHCASVPQELLYASLPSDVRLLHWGYIDPPLRFQKFSWYNKIDPNNEAEDGYRHMLIGDAYPADSRFKWAGPLRVEAI